MVIYGSPVSVSLSLTHKPHLTFKTPHNATGKNSDRPRSSATTKRWVNWTHIIKCSRGTFNVRYVRAHNRIQKIYVTRFAYIGSFFFAHFHPFWIWMSRCVNRRIRYNCNINNKLNTLWMRWDAHRAHKHRTPHNKFGFNSYSFRQKQKFFSSDSFVLRARTHTANHVITFAFVAHVPIWCGRGVPKIE